MGSWIRKVGRGLLLALCVAVCFGCAYGSREPDLEEQEEMQSPVPAEEQEAGEDNQDPSEEEQEKEGFSPERQLKENKDFFWEEADRQKIGRQEGEKCLQVLLDDDIFQGGDRKLTGLKIADMDGNGQMDMLVMVLDAEEPSFYGYGALWIYMDEDEPYCFEEEECSFYGWFDAFWADVDNDENVEIVFSAQGTGCGAVGDSYKAVFKYKDHTIERMMLPSDFEEDYDCGIRVELIQEPEPDSYSAYCPYFDEQIFFHGENIDGWDPPYAARATGGNVRGFYNLCPAEYEGKRVLQASEYLSGEGGNVHCVATAKFLITWEEDGTPRVIKWWIEENRADWGGSRETRICYADGYYYYASQMDHYYLYRAGEDGSDARCLARIHPESICVQDGEIYFINQSDGNGIYRMKTDGTGMEKLCEKGRSLQISAEYVYFCSTYEAEYDRSGMVTEEPREFCAGFLYRMKKDGSERELLAAGVRQYTLKDVNSWYGQEVRYAGSLYCSRRVENELVVSRMDLDGQNEEELCRFDAGKMLMYGKSIYDVVSVYGDKEKISRFDLWDGELTSFFVPEYIDCCIYNNYLYCFNEQEEDARRKVSIYRMELDGSNCSRIYEDSFECEYSQGGYVSDLYATAGGIFFRKFVSKKEGCQWFQLTEDEDTKEWKAEIWEDEEEIPAVLPAQEVEYGELRSAMSVMESVEGYEAYLAEDLEYEEIHLMEEREHPYRIRLPQFNSKAAGYQKINQYFQNAYQEAMKEKEAFFAMLDEEGYEATFNWYQETGYGYVYIDEKYITVAKYESGYWGGIRGWTSEEPVTFDRKSGEVVTLEKLLGMPKQEAVAKLTGSIYKYMEGIGRGNFLLKEVDTLTENYDPEQFFLSADGIAVYYRRYAIDCGAAGDYLFVLPWEETGVFLGDSGKEGQTGM